MGWNYRVFADGTAKPSPLNWKTSNMRVRFPKLKLNPGLKFGNMFFSTINNVIRRYRQSFWGNIILNFFCRSFLHIQVFTWKVHTSFLKMVQKQFGPLWFILYMIFIRRPFWTRLLRLWKFTTKAWPDAELAKDNPWCFDQCMWEGCFSRDVESHWYVRKFTVVINDWDYLICVVDTANTCSNFKSEA